MSCTKYTLSNTTNKTIVINYQECTDLTWEYNVEVYPNEIINVWVIDGTLSSANLSLLNPTFTTFPPIITSPTPTPSITASPTNTPSQTPTDSVTDTPTPTPTNTPTFTSTPTNTQTSTQTPTNTQTSTPTPTNTGSPTPTPTNIVRTRLSDICHSENDPAPVCECLGTATLFVNGTNLADSTLAWADEAGPNTGNPVGWYVQGGIIYEVDNTCGSGCTTGSSISVYGTCPTPTNTPTPTYTPTNTPTPTNIVRTVLGGICEDQTDPIEACDCAQTETLFVNGTSLADSTLAWSDQFGPNTGDPFGYAVQDGIIYLISEGCHSGCTTGSTITVYGVCPTTTTTPTPTTSETPTPTPTTTLTLTPTETSTPTPTPTTTLTLTPTETSTPTPTPSA